MMYKNPERVAWTVIWGAFVVFLALGALVPLSIRYYIQHATAPKEATLEVISGTVRVREPGVAAPLAVTKSVPLPEGSAIETDENSRGILTFLDGSTTILFPSTQITLREMHVSTFAWGLEPVTIVIDQARGSLRIGAAPQLAKDNAPPPARRFQVYTPHLIAALEEGSYRIVVESETSQVSVRDGTANVQALGKTVQVTRGQRTLARKNEAPLPALPAEQDVIVNGDFHDPLPRGWSIVREPASNPTQANGAVTQTALGERPVVHITRSNSNQTSAITGIVQQINREVSDFRVLRFQADVRVHYQNLAGGGILSSEYPLILRLKYRDVYGSEAEWVHGFYYQNITNNPTLNGELVPQDVWIPFESGNMFETLDPHPFFITSIQIYASGWDYDAYVTGVRLIME